LAASGTALAACQPQTVVVEKEVEKVVKETVLVEKEATPVPAGPEGEVLFTTWGGPKEVQTNEVIIELFNGEYEKASAELLHIPSGYLDKVMAMFAAATPPDVMYASGAWVAGFVHRKAILDLSEYFAQNPVLLDDSVYVTRYIKEGNTLQGHNFGTVNGTNAYVVYWNKTLFDEAGVEYPVRGWTWDDMLEAAQALTKTEGDTITQFGVIASRSYQVMETLIRSQGRDLYSSKVMPERFQIDSPEGIWSLQFLQDLIYKYRVAPTAAESEAMPLSSPWESGKVAMEIGHSFAIEHRSEITDWEWDIAHVPMGKEQGGSYSGGMYFVARETENRDAAFEFAKWYMSDAAQGVFALDGLEAPIMRKWRESDAHLKFPGAPEHHSVRGEALEYAIHRGAHHPMFSEVLSKVFTPEQDKLLLNEQTAEETARNIQQGADALLAEVTEMEIN
jgi:multiple sugar transport system substrate-binding protein